MLSASILCGSPNLVGLPKLDMSSLVFPYVATQNVHYALTILDTAIYQELTGD
jgi:hypothetical protein